ncbi:MAG: KH domain-containing protein, partial [archaeon]|nr:KH domain-containing protein [archaeon]
MECKEDNNPSTQLVATNKVVNEDLIMIPDTVLRKKRRTYWDIPPPPSFRKTRWGSMYDKTFTPLSVTEIPKNLSIDKFEILLRHQRLADIDYRLNQKIFEDEEPRSPSPEPIYDPKTGKRINTRSARKEEELNKEKSQIIMDLIKLEKGYKPPGDYKPPLKVKIIYIQDNDKYSFTKYIIGPRGTNQKKLEEQSKCKIFIRGKGSNWNNYNAYNKNYIEDNEPLHICIKGLTDEDIENAEKLLKPLLDPNSEEYKRQKLALTISYNSLGNEPACEFCGEKGHKSWACPKNLEQYVNKTEIKCKYCGDKGHPSCDCPFKPPEAEEDPKKTEEKEFEDILKEADAVKEKTKFPMIKPEIKKSDIVNSVLLTGKATNIENKTNQGEVDSKIEEDINKQTESKQSEDIKSNIIAPISDPNILNDVLKQNDNNDNQSKIKDEIYKSIFTLNNIGTNYQYELIPNNTLQYAVQSNQPQMQYNNPYMNISNPTDNNI